LAYQPPASNTFLSEQISHQQAASSTFLSEQINNSHQPNEQAVTYIVLGNSGKTCHLRNFEFEEICEMSFQDD
jgi:hypothetical protein